MINYWFPYKYVDGDVNKELDKTKIIIAGNKLKKQTKYYVEYLNRDPNWLKIITIEIDQFLIYRYYINFFTKINIEWINDDGNQVLESCSTQPLQAQGMRRIAQKPSNKSVSHIL